MTQMSAFVETQSLRKFNAVLAERGEEKSQILREFVEDVIRYKGEFRVVAKDPGTEAVAHREPIEIPGAIDLTALGLTPEELTMFSDLAVRRGYKSPEEYLRCLAAREVIEAMRPPADDWTAEERSKAQYVVDVLRAPQNVGERGLAQLLTGLQELREKP